MVQVKRRILPYVKAKFLHILPLFLFFLVFFTLINWIETYLFEQAGLTPFKFTEVAIAAALIAKIVLVVDHLPLIHLFRKRPLAYVIVWKTFVYWFCLLVVRLLVHFVPYMFNGDGTIQTDFNAFLTVVNWDLFISIQVYYLMLLFIFVTFQELALKIGVKQLRHILFSKPSRLE